MILACQAALLVCASFADSSGVAVLAAPQWMQSDTMGWFGGRVRVGVALRFERDVTSYVAVAVDLGVARGGDDGLLSLDVYDVRPAVRLSWPRLLLGNAVLAYGRAEAPLSLAIVRVRDARSRTVVPGLAASLGLRAQPRSRVGRRGHVYAFVEAGYAWHLTRRIRLARTDDHAIAGPSTRLGALDLSAAQGRVGIGWGF